MLSGPKETGAGHRFLRHHIATGVDNPRQEEVWSNEAESLISEWSREWHVRAAGHEIAMRWWKRCHYLLEIPSAVLPLAVSAIWGKLPPAEGAPMATGTLALAGGISALATLLQADAQSERHLHASHRYADLISDAEEVLCKQRAFRPDVDVTVQGFKMRSDALLRISPHVQTQAIDDPEPSASEEDTPGRDQHSSLLHSEGHDKSTPHSCVLAPAQSDGVP